MCKTHNLENNISNVKNALKELIEENKKITILSLEERSGLKNKDVKDSLKHINFDMFNCDYHIMIRAIHPVIKHLNVKLEDIKTTGKNDIPIIDLKYKNLSQITNVNYSTFTSLAKKYDNNFLVKKMVLKIDKIKELPNYHCTTCETPLNKSHFEREFCPNCLEVALDIFLIQSIDFLKTIIEEYKNNGSYKNNKFYYQLDNLINAFYMDKHIDDFKRLINSLKETTTKELFELLDFIKNSHKTICKSCFHPLSFNNLKKGFCPNCVEKNPDENHIKCLKCKTYKHINEYPKDSTLKLGHRLTLCRSCDRTTWVKVRRDNAKKYSITEGGRETNKRNGKILKERLFCSSLNESPIKYKNILDLPLSKAGFDYETILNNNEITYKYFPRVSQITIGDFFELKSRYKYEFDHIIPRTKGNTILENEFPEEIEILLSLGFKKEIRKMVSKIMNNEKNIQLLYKFDNNSKHNNIENKDLGLYEIIKDELIEGFQALYDDVFKNLD